LRNSVALKSCKECGNQISDKAESCPQCGAKQPKKTSLFTKIILGLIIFTVILSFIGNNDENNNNNNNVAESSEPKKENKAGVLLFMAQEKIKASAKDPSSLVFNPLKLNQETKYGAVACAEVNGKNSFGGYTGMKGFVVTEKHGILLQDSKDDAKFVEVWNEVCAD
jgi:ribosomal protein L40E